MSNPVNTNGIITNINNLGARDGTRVVLREITASLQNSPPMQHGLRKGSNNTQTGKTEHEVKVQFAREFVDAEAPNSRPESLSSASSFQSLASTFSTRSGVPSSPITPQKAANNSYVDSHIPGLDDLIAACGDIHLNDETSPFESIADSTLTITANDNSFPLPNPVQNISQQEAFASALNYSDHLNGTHDLSLEYEEALENSISLNGTKGVSELENLIRNSNSEPVKDSPPKQTEGNLITNHIQDSPEQTAENLITNHIQDSPDIPQIPIDKVSLNETRDLSLKSDHREELSLNKTVDLLPTPEQKEDNLLEVQNCLQNSNSSESLHSLNQTSELVADCNSVLNNPNSSKSNALNLTHDLSNDNKNLSIDCNSQNATDTRPDQSINELSANQADVNVLPLNNTLNLPPESDADVSSSNIQILPTPEVVVTEALDVDKELQTESDSGIARSVEPVNLTDFEEQKSVQEQKILSDQCIPDSSTDHLPEVILGLANPAETVTCSSVVQDIHENINTEYLQQSIAHAEAEQISDRHNVSTTAAFPEEEKSLEAKENLNAQTAEPQKTAKTPQAVEPEVLSPIKPELESKKLEELTSEKSGEHIIKTPITAEPLETVVSALENIVPCAVPQNLLNSCQELEESKSEELPQVAIDVTPFPGYNLEADQNLTLNLGGSLNADSSGEQDSNETIILKEESFHSLESEGASETYNAFQPVKQSTCLNSDCNFEKLELAAQGIAEEIHNRSLELGDDSDQFFSADPDLFLDPASLDFFLTRNNSKNSVRDLRAESLYVKFDPLVSNVSMLPQGPTQVVDGEENAKNSIPQPTLDTPKRNPALAAIDRLLFYSPATGTPNKVEEPPKIEEKIMEDVKPEPVPIVDETMAKELELVRSTVLQLDAQLEKQKKEHQTELEKERFKNKELELELAREVQKKNEMTMVMDEYEKSLSRHMADRERERASFEQERAKLQEELQAANHHLGNTEAAFNDVHSKYERLKNIVAAYKSNEDVLKESVQENVETIKTLEERYEKLKSHAMTQLEKANLELEGIRKQHETETVRLQAMIRKAELKSNSLAEMVEQKSKENKELAAILDEVIARVGRSPE